MIAFIRDPQVWRSGQPTGTFIRRLRVGLRGFYMELSWWKSR